MSQRPDGAIEQPEDRVHLGEAAAAPPPLSVEYDPYRDEMLIEGVRYNGHLFRVFADPDPHLLYHFERDGEQVVCRSMDPGDDALVRQLGVLMEGSGFDDSADLSIPCRLIRQLFDASQVRVMELRYLQGRVDGLKAKLQLLEQGDARTH